MRSPKINAFGVQRLAFGVQRRCIVRIIPYLGHLCILRIVLDHRKRLSVNHPDYTDDIRDAEPLNYER